MKKILIFLVMCLMLFVFAANGCMYDNLETVGENLNATPEQSAEPTQTNGVVGSSWPKDMQGLCEGLPAIQSGKLTESKISNTEQNIIGNTTYDMVPIYSVVQWLNSLEENGWYIMQNIACKAQKTIETQYETQSGVLTLTINEEINKEVWPDPVSAEFQYVFPVFKYSDVQTISLTDLANYETVYECTVDAFTDTDLTNYKNDLVAAGFKDLGFASNMHVLEKSPYEVEIIASMPWKILLCKHEIFPVPLPPWPEALPEAFARVLPLWQGPVESIEAYHNGYKIGVNHISLNAVRNWYNALAHYGWEGLSPDGTANHNEKGFVITEVDYDSTTGNFVFVIEEPGYDAQQSTPPPTQSAQGNTLQEDIGGMIEYEGYAYVLTSCLYDETDLEKGIMLEFGKNAVVADWTELKQNFSDNILELFRQTGVRENEDVWINYNDKAYYKQSRRYFMAYINGNKRSDFLIHDKWGDDLVWIGSWHGMRIRAMVKLPREEYYNMTGY